MLRGYRCILVAAFGLALSGSAQPPTKDAQTKSAKANSQPSATPFAAYPSVYSNRCYQAQDHDAADLCAQWRAALAAEKAAEESRRAVNWTIISVAVSVFGIALIWASLRNEHIAQRPYVFLFRTLKKRDAWTNEIKEIEGVNFRNVGKSFAYIEALTVRSGYADDPPKPKNLVLEKYPPSSAIIPAEEWPLKNAVPITREGEALHRPPSGPQRLFVEGRMLYRDAYNRRYHLWFCRVYSTGTFGFAPNDIPDLETHEYNGTESLSPLSAWLMRRSAKARTA